MVERFRINRKGCLTLACQKELFQYSEENYNENYAKNQSQDHTVWRKHGNCSATTFSNSQSMAISWSKHQLSEFLSPLLPTNTSKANTTGQTHW